MYLSSLSKDRNNNLDLIRIIAATMVLFCHSFPISLGNGFMDFLGSITNRQITFGNLAVCIFFCYGGFLISGSLERSKSANSYFKKRIKRLFPSLIATILLTVFILGPIFTNINIIEYFKSSDTYKYLFNMLLIPVHSLPGVFENNAYGNTINGSLWTLPIEFLCYILCFVMFFLKFGDKNKAGYSMVLFIPIYIFLFFYLRSNALLGSALRPIGMFYIGVLYYIYRENIIIKRKIAYFCLGVCCIFTIFGLLEIVIVPCLSYFLMYIGFAAKLPKLKTPDISYQVYLLGFPVQQTLCYMFGGSMNPYINFFLAVPVTFILAKCLVKLVNSQIN